MGVAQRVEGLSRRRVGSVEGRTHKRDCCGASLGGESGLVTLFFARRSRCEVYERWAVHMSWRDFRPEAQNITCLDVEPLNGKVSATYFSSQRLTESPAITSFLSCTCPEVFISWKQTYSYPACSAIHTKSSIRLYWLPLLRSLLHYGEQRDYFLCKGFILPTGLDLCICMVSVILPTGW
jgi:hypothetical protein